MVIVLTGSNEFEHSRKVQTIRSEFAQQAEIYDGEALDATQLLELTRGITLFASNRLIIIKQLSLNKVLWGELISFLEHAQDSSTIVLVEPSIDKRSKAYKWLQKNASVQQFDEWTPRDTFKAEKWCEHEAVVRDIMMDRALIKKLVQRTGVQQWRISTALDKLELVEKITEEAIENIVEPHLEENVFELLGAALSKNLHSMQQMLAALSKTDDPYRVFGLLTSQIIQLSSLLIAQKSANSVAADLGSSPYVLKKLTPYATQLSPEKAKDLLAIAAKSDMQLKQTGVNPWIIIEAMLLRLARV